MIDDLTPALLAARVERLERMNRRLAVLLAGALALGIFACAAPDEVGAQQTRTLEGEKLLIRTTEGKIGAVISMGQDGAPNMDLIDKNGKFRVRLGLAPDGSARIQLADEDGKTVWKAP